MAALPSIRFVSEADFLISRKKRREEKRREERRREERRREEKRREEKRREEKKSWSEGGSDKHHILRDETIFPGLTIPI
jgi:hypothetical protein